MPITRMMSISMLFESGMEFHIFALTKSAIIRPQRTASYVCLSASSLCSLKENSHDGVIRAPSCEIGWEIWGWLTFLLCKTENANSHSCSMIFAYLKKRPWIHFRLALEVFSELCVQNASCSLALSNVRKPDPLITSTYSLRCRWI